jgi:UDP-N-acetylmuramoylalanine--D-glutamate ligase
MIEVAQFSGKTIAVMGLGRSGLATARALMAGGAELWAWDDVEEARKRARTRGVPLVDLKACDWSRPAALILSPGIPLTLPAPHPVVRRAREAGTEIVCDVELLARARGEARFIGVTGTNGKSTTTALIGHILESAGLETQIGGNIGAPALALEPLSAHGTYVLELSSYQLDLTLSVSFDVAVLLNISPDHLDRHGGLDGYIAAKRRIFRNQGAAGIAVVGVDDDHSRGVCEDMAEAAAQRVIPISGRRRVAGGVYVLDGWLHDDTEGRGTRAADLTQAATLTGPHNWQNAAAAFAAAKSVGVAPPTIAAGLRSFPGLPHRQEQVAVIDGVRYVNDSKATNADAAANALGCYPDIYWIVGGQAKEGGITELAPYLEAVAHAFLIGAAATGFAATLKGRVPFTLCGDLATAVAEASRLARADARPAPVVLAALPGRREPGPVPKVPAGGPAAGAG